ncbi:MAG: TonB-dependent receptor [Phenylobacterium sp.]|nr:TonB-dependent receptor [Phenylobacterium sp.]
MSGFQRAARRRLFATALGLTLGAAAAASAQTPSAADQASDVVEVDQLVVTASAFERKIVDAPASISVISREALQTKRFSSLAEALADVEGVDVGDGVGKTGGLNISIRGMPSDYTLVLVDGRRQNAAGNVTPNGFGETSTSFMPPTSAIERIEVVRGPMSTLYGSDAMGGVVNIITRRIGDRWRAATTVQGTLQSDDQFGATYGAEAYVDGPIVPDVLGLALRGSVFKREASDLSYVNANGQPVEISKRGPSPVEADIWTLGGRLSFAPAANHDLWLDVDVAEQTYDNSDSQLGTGTVQGGYGPELRFEREQYGLAHDWRSPVGLITSDLVRNVTTTIGRTIPPGTPGRTAGDPRTLEATNTIFNTRLATEMGRHAFTVGGQWWEAEMVDGVATGAYEHTQWAVFAEDEWRLADNLALTVGVRHDDHSKFGGQTSPRAYLVWTASEAWTVKGGVSRGFKTPRLDQIASGITGFTAQGTVPTIGTPTLQPETSTTAEIGVYYDNGAGFSANLTVFNSEFEDKIASGPGLPNCSFAGSPNRPGCVNYGNFPRVDLYGQTVNIDEAVTRGVEAAGRYALNEAWTVSANYTYTDSEQKSGPAAGQPLVNTPEHMLNGSVRWRATDQLNAWVRTEVRSDRYRGAGAAQTALGDYKGYALFHLGGSYQVADNVRINATIYNLFDQDFLDYLPYASGATTAYAGAYAIQQEPRRLWVSVNVDF